MIYAFIPTPQPEIIRMLKTPNTAVRGHPHAENTQTSVRGHPHAENTQHRSQRSSAC